MELRVGIGISGIWWWWWCVLFLALAVASSARNITPFTGGEEWSSAGRRALMGRGVSLNDYGEPGANRGHDPPRRGRRP